MKTEEEILKWAKEIIKKHDIALAELQQGDWSDINQLLWANAQLAAIEFVLDRNDLFKRDRHGFVEVKAK
jgi:hypothetical protein